MSQLNTIQELFRHYDWAQEKMLASTGGLAAGQLDQPFPIGPGSLRKAMQHVHDAERVWVQRCSEQGSATPAPAIEGEPISAIRRRASETARQRQELLASLNDQALDRDISYVRAGQPQSMPLRDILLQVCNHAMHHRAQAIHMLRHLGVNPPLTEYLFMQIESPQDPPPQLSVSMLRDYIAYTDWARDRLLSAAAGLSVEQLDRPFDMGMESIRKTLVHLGDADKWWMDNWVGGDGRVFPKPSESTPIDELRGRCREISEQRNRFLASLSDQDLNRAVSAQPEPGQHLSFPLGQTMLEVCNHGTHHRAHAINMLRQAGVTTPPTDYIAMRREQTSA